MLTSIDRLMIATNDLEQAENQCMALLGRSPSWAGEYPGVGMRHVLFCLANTRIELLAPSEETESNAGLRAHLEEHGPGLYGLALETGDLRAVIDETGEADTVLDAPASLLARDAAS
ncbi:MAG: VOC family protein, partial [Myxococcota bacterium]